MLFTKIGFTVDVELTANVAGGYDLRAVDRRQQPLNIDHVPRQHSMAADYLDAAHSLRVLNIEISVVGPRDDLINEGHPVSVVFLADVTAHVERGGDIVRVINNQLVALPKRGRERIAFPSIFLIEDTHQVQIA